MNKKIKKCQKIAIPEEVVKTDADKPKKDFHIGEFLTRVRENDGKLETEEDQQLFDDEVQGMMDKMVRSVRVASDNERAEIRELAIKKKEAVANSNVDQAERDRLVQRKLDAYDFLKSVRFAISARPAFREFKRLSDAQYETVLSLAAEGIDEQQPQRPLTEIEASTADAIIYARTAWYTKTGTFFKKVGQKIGKFFAKTFIWTAKKMKLLKSREKTSGELEREEQKKAKKEASLEAKRWKALHIAVRKLRFGEYEKCQRLQAPIQLALYGEGPMALADEHNGSAIREAHAKDGNKALADLHARLGAQLVNSMLNIKQFPEGVRVFFGVEP